MPEDADRHGMRSMSDAQLENIAAGVGLPPNDERPGAARAELARRRRGHERALVDKQVQAAEKLLAAAVDTAKAT